MVNGGLVATPRQALGRHLEAALWVLVALDGDPLDLTSLLDAVRSLDGPIGPATLVGAVARLERLGLVESHLFDSRRTVYRLTIVGRAASRSAAILEGRRR